MRHRVYDAYGHVRLNQEVRDLRAALLLINDSETIAAMEESANHHSAHDFRREMAKDLHVADVTKWGQATWDERWEEAMCKICGADLEREKKT